MELKMNSKKLYSVDDVQVELSIGRTMVFQLIKNKRLKAVKIGDRTLVSSEDLDTFIASLRAA